MANIISLVIALVLVLSFFYAFKVYSQYVHRAKKKRQMIHGQNQKVVRTQRTKRQAAAAR